MSFVGKKFPNLAVDAMSEMGGMDKKEALNGFMKRVLGSIDK